MVITRIFPAVAESERKMLTCVNKSYAVLEYLREVVRYLKSFEVVKTPLELEITHFRCRLIAVTMSDIRGDFLEAVQFMGLIGAIFFGDLVQRGCALLGDISKYADDVTKMVMEQYLAIRDGYHA